MQSLLSGSSAHIESSCLPAGLELPEQTVKQDHYEQPVESQGDGPLEQHTEVAVRAHGGVAQARLGERAEHHADDERCERIVGNAHHEADEADREQQQDVFIAVCDGLKGLPEAINTTWEQTVVQQCNIHLIRNSFRYAGRQHRDAIVKALKPVYTAPSEGAAKDRFEEFAAKWGERYPAIVQLRKSAWAEFVPFIEYDVEIRRVICTTNAIEPINAKYRRAVWPRGTSRTRPQRSNVCIS